MSTFRQIVCLGCIAVLSACSAPKTLYYWGGNSGDATQYEEKAYGMYKTLSPEALCELLCVYEDMVKHPSGERQVPPPGICAEYAYYLSMPETAQIFASTAKKSQKNMFARADYASFFPEYAKELFEKELTLYPESAVFIKPIITKLLQQ